ncbi:hypothetical protein E1B28_011607 [Marasmius oreades]|uniref:Uncharacterized protein n=1 Tax=Marasmius oreades TaxID=181124 RepID=A0A9P7RUH5_9AGAR|nr:uncharacterized protein E1B28_011607 [Marasmius oreades]KAG7089984.1 hypothetical protein E1B28_011607 [Marasmius oreades]
MFKTPPKTHCLQYSRNLLTSYSWHAITEYVTKETRDCAQWVGEGRFVPNQSVLSKVWRLRSTSPRANNVLDPSQARGKISTLGPSQYFTGLTLKDPTSPESQPHKPLTTLEANELQDYIFSRSPENKSIWTRKCYGLESFESTASEILDGISFVTATIAIKPAYDQAMLEPSMKKAWIALRHSLPAIALKSSRLPAPDNHFTLTYHVPKDFKQVQTWVDETLFFTNEVKGVYEMHKQLKDEQWWRPANGHWVGELHVSPIEDGWQCSIVFNHNSIDGRSVFVVLNELLAKLVPILDGSAKPVSELRWGEETKRLPPAAIAILAKENIYPKKDQAVLPLSQRSVWTWPPAKSSSSTARDVSALVTLPVETTSKLHAISKLHGRTITPVINALSILAHTEVSLATAAKAGPERFEIVSRSYKESEVYEVAFTLANYRHKFPEPYNSLTSETSSPFVAVGAMPLFVPMDVVREFFRIDDSTSSASVSSTNLLDAFWDGLVDAAANSWNDYDMSLHEYATHEEESHEAIHNFDHEVFHIPALAMSSVGDMGRLNLFNAYLPSQRNETLTVVDMVVGQRMRVPAVLNICWQYAGKLQCHWATGGEWMTEEELQQVVDSFMRWIKILVVSVDLETRAKKQTGAKF